MSMNNKSNIHYKYDISDISELLNFNKDEKGDEKDKKYEELRIRTEENIKMLKEQIFQIMELSFKNKSDISLISLSLKTIENTQKELNELITDIENYKKITNERIEKIFKLLMMTNIISPEGTIKI